MAESKAVEEDCIPFTAVPHITPLFADFLYHFAKVSRFYAHDPLTVDWAGELKRISYPQDRREVVASVLERQNLAFGAGQKTLDNIQRLRKGAPVMVTGQQVTLFGGPVFSILKVLTAVMHAEQANAVPVFWLATEDHDLAEVSTINLPGSDHAQKFSVSFPHIEGAPVGTIVFSDEIAAALQQVESLFGDSEVLALLKASYRPGATFGSAFGRFYAQLFAGSGIVLLDPSDPELHRIARPVYLQAVVQWKEINDALQRRSQELENAGYHAQVKVTPSHTLCFYLQDGVRTPVRHALDGFWIGERNLSDAELAAEAERCPERFSANVLLRPALQDYLLPTLAYLGGPSEVAYFAQVAVVYEKLLGKVTPVIPRMSATLVEPRQAKLLDRYHLSLQDVFHAGDKLSELLAGKALPESILRSFGLATEHVEQALTLIAGPLEKLDPTLADAAQNSGAKMRHQLQSLRDKAVRAEARKNAETQHHADELSALLFPNKELQEREVGAAYFLLKYGTGVLGKLRDALQLNCPDHQIVRIQS
ncbi:MAG TPA: bacillithiol biosynthesis cysteine-adding enzyme BshC [Verrucomicrobiae bacterium]|jgi:bacillithiol biosynthesis cysteine-adding enzyme BshC|nr:bacillithiol biosynthesis cysteine-adding enzyme BshC [Verrucomicrobiae bacterium]